MSSASNVVAMLQNIKAMAGEEVFASALASMMPKASTIKTAKVKTEKDPNAPKRSVPAGVTAWTEHVKSVLADMIENGWEPFSIKDKVFAGSESTEEGHVFADSRKKPTYSQALTVAKLRKGSSASSVASAPEEPEKKKGGRPKGSKNKPKVEELPLPLPLPMPAPVLAAAPASAAVPLPESEAEDEGHASDSSSQKKRGRKPMTAEQKAAAKAEREAKLAAMTAEELAAFNTAKAAKKEANKAKKASKEAK